jgi:hypothetical protein
MSTSFIPRNKDAGDSGCNISGAVFLRDLLDKLGFDAPISGVGYGPQISAKTANAWGMAILKAFEENRIALIKTKDDTMQGGYRSRAAILTNGEWDTKVNGNQPPEQDVVTIDEGTMNWLNRTAKFFMLCGGFRQI